VADNVSDGEAVGDLDANPAGANPAGPDGSPGRDEEAGLGAAATLVAAADGSLPTPDGARRPLPVVRRRVLVDSRPLEGLFERVLTRLPGVVSAGLEPLRAELAATRAALEEQSRLRMHAEARAASAERELDVLRAQIAEAAARPAGLFRRRSRPIVLTQP